MDAMGQVGGAPAAPEQTQAGAAPAQTTPVSPASAPATVGGSVAAPPGGGGVSGVAGAGSAAPPVQQAAQAQAQAAMSVRDALKGYGLDLGGSFQDDHQVLAHMAQMYRLAQQNHQMAQYGQQYVQHADKFQAYLKSQQDAAQAQQAAQQKSWWNPPEFDQSWTQKIVRDPQTGELRTIPGADPSLVQKYMGWVEHQRNFLDKLSQDPIAAIKPGLEQMIDQRAQQLMDQRFGNFQEQNQAKQFVQQNSQWLHQRDQQSGQVVIDPRTQMPALSPAGQRFLGYVQQAEQMGLNTQAQQQYAMGFLQRDVLYAQQQAYAQQQSAQQPAQLDPAQAAKNAFLQNAAQGGAVRPASPGNVNGASPPIGGGSRGLQDLLMADMLAAGFQPGQQIS